MSGLGDDPGPDPAEVVPTDNSAGAPADPDAAADAVATGEPAGDGAGRTTGEPAGSG